MIVVNKLTNGRLSKTTPGQKSPRDEKGTGAEWGVLRQTSSLKTAWEKENNFLGNQRGQEGNRRPWGEKIRPTPGGPDPLS